MNEEEFSAEEISEYLYEEYLYFEYKDQLEGANKEIDRLNNIISQLEKYINKTKLEEFKKVYRKRCGKTFIQAEIVICNMILDKLKELKNGDNNE